MRVFIILIVVTLIGGGVMFYLVSQETNFGGFDGVGVLETIRTKATNKAEADQLVLEAVQKDNSLLVPDSLRKIHAFEALNVKDLDLNVLYFDKSPKEIYFLDADNDGLLKLRFVYKVGLDVSYGVFENEIPAAYTEEESARVNKRLKSLF